LVDKPNYFLGRQFICLLQKPNNLVVFIISVDTQQNIVHQLKTKMMLIITNTTRARGLQRLGEPAAQPTAGLSLNHEYQVNRLNTMTPIIKI
jgi:hypothetical protein